VFRIFIEDRRPVYPYHPPRASAKSVVNLKLGVSINADGHTSGKWCVSAQELLLEVQASNSAIKGGRCTVHLVHLIIAFLTYKI